MTRVRVVRVLVYEGTKEWIDKTLERSFITSTPFVAGTNTIYELSSTTFQEPNSNGQPPDHNQPRPGDSGSEARIDDRVDITDKRPSITVTRTADERGFIEAATALSSSSGS